MGSVRPLPILTGKDAKTPQHRPGRWRIAEGRNDLPAAHSSGDPAEAFHIRIVKEHQGDANGCTLGRDR